MWSTSNLIETIYPEKERKLFTDREADLALLGKNTEHIIDGTGTTDKVTNSYNVNMNGTWTNRTAATFLNTSVGSGAGH
ncbi:MAG: hypothetical protein U9P81_07465 [Euryarchaeota archaeon]|nr:hypothetical protein [Euryarchaeota archaeon]